MSGNCILPSWYKPNNELLLTSVVRHPWSSPTNGHQGITVSWWILLWYGTDMIVQSWSSSQHAHICRTLLGFILHVKLCDWYCFLTLEYWMNLSIFFPDTKEQLFGFEEAIFNLHQLIGPWEIWIEFSINNFKLILVIDGWGIFLRWMSAVIVKFLSCEWMPLNTFDTNSTLIQVMTWCHQATSHYLSQCWPRSMSLYGGITRPQWVNSGLLGVWSLVPRAPENKMRPC